MQIELPDDHPVAQALKIIQGDRYGKPERNFGRIAKLWSVIFGIDVQESQVAWAMVALKMAREASATKDDNLVDAIGYLALQAQMDYEKKDSKKSEQELKEKLKASLNTIDDTLNHIRSNK